MVVLWWWWSVCSTGFTSILGRVYRCVAAALVVLLLVVVLLDVVIRYEDRHIACDIWCGVVQVESREKRRGDAMWISKPQTLGKAGKRQ